MGARATGARVAVRLRIPLIMVVAEAMLSVCLVLRGIKAKKSKGECRAGGQGCALLYTADTAQLSESSKI